MTQQDLTTAFAGLSAPEDIFARAIEVFSEFGEGWLGHGVIDVENWALAAYTSNFPPEMLASFAERDMAKIDYASRYLADNTALLSVDLADPDLEDRVEMNTLLRQHKVIAFLCQPVPAPNGVGGVTFCARAENAAQMFKDPAVQERFTLAAFLFNAAHDQGIEAMRPSAKSPVRRSFLLSPREYEALSLVAKGMRVEGIADRMNVSVPAAKKFLALARGKLGAKTQAQAIAIAVSRKMIAV